MIQTQPVLPDGDAMLRLIPRMPDPMNRIVLTTYATASCGGLLPELTSLEYTLSHESARLERNSSFQPIPDIQSKISLNQLFFRFPC